MELCWELILEFIAEQLNAADLALPAGLQNWKAEDIQITKLENLPGVQGNRRATAKVSGTYLAAGEKDLTKRTPFTTKHLKFIIEKSLFDEGVKFDITLSSPADRDISIQLASKADPALIHEKLWQYRIHAQSMSNQNLKVS